MEPDELDRELEELETRVERLRALYEQYFIGIEKIEPLVPRKDVDRRIWRLRRVQIRNTGKRFRLQTIIQRYNTFQQYWMRICREIEAGTYIRHLQRAKKIMADAEPLTIAARKRHRANRRAMERLDEEEQTRRERAESATKELEDLASLIDQPGALDSAMQSVDELLANETVPPRPTRSPPRRPRRSHEQLENLELELDSIEGKLQPSEAPSRRASEPIGPHPLPLPPPAPPPLQPRPAPPLRSPPGQPRTPLLAANRPPPPPPGVSRPAGPPPRIPQPPPKPAGLGSRPQPPPKSRPQPPAPTRPAAVPTQPRGPFSPTTQASLTEDRVRELHGKLQEAKRRTNDTSRLSVDGLRKSLQSAEAKLRSKHGAHRQVDFQVVIKNGKAVLKPVVR